MSVSSFKLALGGGCLAFALASVARAQALSAHDRADCERASAIVAKGHPEKTIPSAMQTVGKCGATGGNAIATGLLTYAHDTDPKIPDEYTYQMAAWRDAAVLNAATELATDTSATPVARVFAVRYLIVLIHPYMSYTYEGLTRGEVTTRTDDRGEIKTIGCPAQIGSERGDRVGTPLPSDYAARAQATLEALGNASSAPRVVRNAARCWK
ncbi:MAG TPA: hypothetical protein VGM50_05730 [Gemmatimonadaceae bacterium]